MSHIATVNVEIKDLAHLQAACERVGLEFVRDETSAEHYHAGGCLHAIRIPQGQIESVMAGVKERTGITLAPSQIAVCAAASGRGFELRYEADVGGWGLETLAGKGCVELKKAYTIVAARAAAVKQGFRVQELHKANGSIELKLVK